MRNTFFACRNLTNINLSTWDTNKVTDMGYMFYNNSKLSNIDFRNANFSGVKNYASMMSGVKSGVNVIVKDEAAKTFIKARSSASNPIIYIP